jgi:cell division septation protein DedD
MPATVPPAGPLPDEDESQQRDRRPMGRRRSLWVGGAVVTAFVGVLLVWLSDGGERAALTNADVPLVKAAESPVKVRPEDPGGMHVAHRDKLIYQRFEGDETAPVVERLLSAPEEPLPPPRAQPEPSMPWTLDMDETPPSGFMVAPPGETVLAAPVEEFLDNVAPEVPLTLEVPLTPEVPLTIDTSPDPSSVAMAAPRPRPTSPPPPASGPASRETSGSAPGLSAEARVAQSLLMGTVADGYAIQLGSVRSRQEANVEWERLRRNHGDILGGLRPQVVEADLGQRGMFYRLQAGPITSQTSARQLCTSLVDRKVACIVVQH